MSNLKARIISALVLALFVLVATVAGGWLFAAMASLIGLFVWSEWIDVTCPNSDDRLRGAGLAAIVAIFLFSLMLDSGSMLFIGLLLLAGIVAVTRMLSRENWPVAGFVYAGGTLIALISLRNSGGWDVGLIAILFLFATVWATDIGAYFAGRHFGGPKIAPAISPNKTWSGGIGGIICAIVAGVLVFAFAGLADTSLAALLALILSVVSQAGDFFESWLKRRNGVKDSGSILPGHGGFMDRVDGLVFAAITLWLLGVFSAGAERPAEAFFSAAFTSIGRLATA
jgi:phosphatidate cytidylyltransferase